VKAVEEFTSETWNGVELRITTYFSSAQHTKICSSNVRKIAVISTIALT